MTLGIVGFQFETQAVLSPIDLNDFPAQYGLQVERGRRDDDLQMEIGATVGSGGLGQESEHDLIGFLPQNNMEVAPFFTPLDSPDRTEEDLTTIIPESPNQPYDMVDVVAAIFDDGEFYQVHEHFATNLIVGFSRLDGYTVGVIGNQPMSLAGDIHYFVPIYPASCSPS